MRLMMALMITNGWFVAMGGATGIYGTEKVTSMADYSDAVFRCR